MEDYNGTLSLAEVRQNRVAELQTIIAQQPELLERARELTASNTLTIDTYRAQQQASQPEVMLQTGELVDQLEATTNALAAMTAHAEQLAAAAEAATAVEPQTVPHTVENRKGFFSKIKESTIDRLPKLTRGRIARLGAAALAAFVVTPELVSAQSDNPTGNPSIDTPAQTKAYQAMLKHAEEAKTVPGFVKRLRTSPENAAANISYIFSDEHKPDKSEFLADGAFCSIKNLERYGGKVNSMNIIEALADCAASDDKALGKLYMMSIGSNSNHLPPNVSIPEARKHVEKILIAFAEKAHIRRDIKGPHMNHGRDMHKVFDAGVEQIHEGDEVFVIPITGGKHGRIEMRFKMFKGHGDDDCVNPLNTVVVLKQQPRTPTAPPQHELPVTPTGAGKPTPPVTPTSPGKPEQPVTPTGQEKPKEKPMKEAKPNPSTGRPNDGDKGSKTGKEEPVNPQPGVSPPDVPRQPQDPSNPGVQPPVPPAPQLPPAETGPEPAPTPPVVDPVAPSPANPANPPHGPNNDPSQVPG